MKVAIYKQWTKWSLFLILFGAVTPRLLSHFGLTRDSEETVIGERLVEAASAQPYRIRIADLTDFRWKKLCIIYPYENITEPSHLQQDDERRAATKFAFIKHKFVSYGLIGASDGVWWLLFLIPDQEPKIIQMIGHAPANKWLHDLSALQTTHPQLRSNLNVCLESDDASLYFGKDLFYSYFSR